MPSSAPASREISIADRDVALDDLVNHDRFQNVRNEAGADAMHSCAAYAPADAPAFLGSKAHIRMTACAAFSTCPTR